MNGKASTNKSTFHWWHQAGRTKIRSYTKRPAYWWLFIDILWPWRRDLYQNNLAYYVKMALWKRLDFPAPPCFVDLWKYFLCISRLAPLPGSSRGVCAGRQARLPTVIWRPPQTSVQAASSTLTRLIHNMHIHTQLKAGLNPIWPGPPF